MKNILFILSVLVMIVVVGCSTPTIDNSVEETVEQIPSTPVEDKSPFEYVKPACVNLADYTYVGDYIFADSMNFTEWKYSNSETGYLLAFEKIARVKNDNPDTRIVRVNHNDPDTEIPVIKATKYKIYVKTSVVETTANNGSLINAYVQGISETYDGTRIRIRKISETVFQIVTNELVGNISDYVEY